MKDLDTLEAAFQADLRAALLRAMKGGSPKLFSLQETGERSSARKLRARAERLMELRRTYSTDPGQQSAGARYLYACLRWQHLHNGAPEAVPVVARDLLKELEAYAT